MTQFVTSQNIDLETLKIEGGKLGVRLEGLSSLVPAAKADQFLKQVQVSGSNLLFLVGSADSEEDQKTLTVAISDLLTGVATQSALDTINEKMQALEAKAEKIAQLEQALEGIEDVKNKVTTMEGEVEELNNLKSEVANLSVIPSRVQTLEDNYNAIPTMELLTTSNLSTITFETPVNAQSPIVQNIREAILGEEVKDLGDQLQGYLIRAEG